MIGRTILIEINIDGPRWANGNFDEEMRHFLNHTQASMHMWGDDGWQDKVLLGTDRMPTGMLRLAHGHHIDGLPERTAVDAQLVEAVRRKIVDSLTVSAAKDTTATPGSRRGDPPKPAARNIEGPGIVWPSVPTMQSPDLGKLPSASVKGGRIVSRDRPSKVVKPAKVAEPVVRQGARGARPKARRK